MASGLALFLTGMNMMSDSLTGMTGGVLNRLLGAITSKKSLAFLFGAVLTAVVQSSSATTVLSVGLVNSGMIELSKAAGMIIGANLGTTATAWLMSLNAIDGSSLALTLLKPSTFAPFLALIGVFMKLFCRSEKKKTIGSILLGFGIMMLGMHLMSEGVAPLREVKAVRDMLVTISNPFLGFLAGAAFAALIQSSDAVIGILQAFAVSVGVIYGTAIPVICGAQVGTCVTAMLSSLGTSGNGKRTALVNLYYNVLKTVPFMIIFYILNGIFSFSFMDRSVGGIGIPLVHTLVNLAACVVWLPLSGVIVSLAQRTIPLSETEKEEQANSLRFLDKNLLNSPSFAVEQTFKAVDLLARTVDEAFLDVIDISQASDNQHTARLLCNRTESYRKQIDAYLRQIASCDLGKKELADVRLLSSANAAFGRMGNVAERIVKAGDIVAANRDHLSSQDYKDVLILGEAVSEIIQLTIRGFVARSITLPQTIHIYREEVQELGNIVKKRFIHRMHNEEGTEMKVASLFTDICYTEEQLIDYCDMIAEALSLYGTETGAVAQSDQTIDEAARRKIHSLFEDKYGALGM